jgi:hypothetical protein
MYISGRLGADFMPVKSVLDQDAGANRGQRCRREYSQLAFVAADRIHDR